MSKDLRFSEEVCERFGNLSWHDSKLDNLRIYVSEDRKQHHIAFEIKLLINSQPGNYKWKDAELILKDCRIVKLDLDLLGKQLCGGDIASAICEKDSSFKGDIESERLKEFDLPQDDNALEDLLHFRILLIHPGGEIDVIARDFELID